MIDQVNIVIDDPNEASREAGGAPPLPDNSSNLATDLVEYATQVKATGVNFGDFTRRRSTRKQEKCRSGADAKKTGETLSKCIMESISMDMSGTQALKVGAKLTADLGNLCQNAYHEVSSDNIDVEVTYVEADYPHEADWFFYTKVQTKKEENW